MSRAFVKESDGDPEPDFRLPDPQSPYYDEAAAWALLRSADVGDTRSAELATGCDWGEPRLRSIVASILEGAVESGDDRLAQLARRFLKAGARG